MDKFFLLTYTSIGRDGVRHSRYGWFFTEEEMRSFVTETEKAGGAIEVDLAIEILSHRDIVL